MINGASRIHYTTRAERRLSENAIGINNGYVIPLGIDVKKLAKSVGKGSYQRLRTSLYKDKYVLVLCRLHPKKGLRLLLDVFLEITRLEEFKNWRLVMVGDGESGYVENLRHFVREHNGDRRVLFAGWLEGDDKIAVLQKAALFALPSHQENFGLSVAEAMACGVPVLISTKVNLADEINKAKAGWVIPLDRNALFIALIKCLRNEDERILRGAAGQRLVKSRFTWPIVARELVRLYRSILNGKSNNVSVS
jgi:glycosyltransferase involved in cell wall biosynthesis